MNHLHVTMKIRGERDTGRERRNRDGDKEREGTEREGTEKEKEQRERRNREKEQREKEQREKEQRERRSREREGAEREKEQRDRERERTVAKDFRCAVSRRANAKRVCLGAESSHRGTICSEERQQSWLFPSLLHSFTDEYAYIYIYKLL